MGNSAANEKPRHIRGASLQSWQKLAPRPDAGSAACASADDEARRESCISSWSHPHTTKSPARLRSKTLIFSLIRLLRHRQSVALLLLALLVHALFPCDIFRHITGSPAPYLIYHHTTTDKPHSTPQPCPCTAPQRATSTVSKSRPVAAVSDGTAKSLSA